MHTPIAPSRPSLSVPGLSLLASLCCIAFGLTAASAQAAEGKAAAEPIPFAQLGAKATADYKGDAIGITATAQGASLHTGFQKLSGTVTHEGLWLNSTDTDGGSLHLVASSLGRE